jgi:hypothetical protein
VGGEAPPSAGLAAAFEDVPSDNGTLELTDLTDEDLELLVIVGPSAGLLLQIHGDIEGVRLSGLEIGEVEALVLGTSSTAVAVLFIPARAPDAHEASAHERSHGGEALEKAVATTRQPVNGLFHELDFRTF